MRPYPKKQLKKKKRAGDVTQVVQHLPSKHIFLSSNPSTTKKKKLWHIYPKELYVPA
jgi:hypothetical protein